MKEYKNFYETIDEARMRLFGTIVVHDGEPYNVHYIATFPDVFKLYLVPILDDDEPFIEPPSLEKIRYTEGEDAVGPFFDKWLVENPKSCIVAKPITDPGFNKFRPFPLGMVNYDAKVYYAERQPLRKTEQGLIQSSIDAKRVYIGNQESPPESFNSPVSSSRRPKISIYTNDFGRTIKGDYPSPEDCLVNLLDNQIINQGAAFNRQFALIRGPIGLIFLAYKTDIIGVLPYNSLSSVTIGRDFTHLREAIDDLGVFHNISFQR